MCLFLFSSVTQGVILPALVTHERRISPLHVIFPTPVLLLKCYSCASTWELQSALHQLLAALTQWGLSIFCCLDSFLLPTCLPFIYRRFPKELIKSLCLCFIIVFILLTTSNLLVRKVIFNLPTASIGFLWHILGTAPVSPISEPAVGC